MPSRLNEYPVGTVMPTTGFETPRCSILAMRRGSADLGRRGRDDEQVLAAEVLHQREDVDPATAHSSDPSTTTMNSAHVM